MADIATKIPAIFQITYYLIDIKTINGNNGTYKAPRVRNRHFFWNISNKFSVRKNIVKFFEKRFDNFVLLHEV